MLTHELSDAELLSATDTRSFELFYRRHFESLLGFFARRIRDPELAAAHVEAFRRGYETRRRWPDVEDDDFEDLIAVRRLSITNLNVNLADSWPNASRNIARHAEVVRAYLTRK